MSKLFQRGFVLGLLLVSVAALMYFGVLGAGRDKSLGFGFDFNVMYQAGRAWLAGLDPYNQEELRKIAPTVGEAPFSYPPSSAFFFVPLALLNNTQASIGWLLVNLSAIAAIVWLSILIARPFALAKGDWVGLGVISAAIIGNPITTNVVWQGQTSLVALAGTMGAWVFSRQARWLPAGLCLAIAALKPPICVFVVVWFLLERQWKLLSTAVVANLLMSLYPMLTQGPIRVFQQWILRLATHQSFPANQPGFEHIIGVQSLLHAAGLPVPSLMLLGLILTVALWFFRQEFRAEDYLGLLMALTLLFVFNTDASYVCIVPIFVSLLIHGYEQPRAIVAAIVLGAVLVFPRRVVRIIDAPVVYHWRTVVIALLLALLTHLSLTYHKRHKLTSAGTGQDL